MNIVTELILHNTFANITIRREEKKYDVMKYDSDSLLNYMDVVLSLFDKYIQYTFTL